MTKRDAGRAFERAVDSMDRRSFMRVSATAAAAGWMSGRPHALVGALDTEASFAKRPTPSSSQLAWQRDELAMFLHFGVNTFTNREWGDGTEDPSIFAPARLDARQWARTARAAGFRAMILTAKHHDGFCLWPSATTTHTVAHSPFRNGSGDVVREFVDACRAEGLRPGLYLSPWDRNNPAYGDSPRYNDLYGAQLTELLTRYGSLAEVWFDGANGEGPNGKRQTYDWPRVWALVHRLQPKAVMFSDAGPDVRWCGNENGSAGDPNWSAVDPSIVQYPGVSGPGVTNALQHGDPNGTVWRPAEADTSIRPGWFHHPAEDDRVRTVDALVQLYFRSVGRNSKLLLNVPPTKDGVLHDTDIARLTGFRERLTTLFATDLAAHAKRHWQRATGGNNSAVAELDFGHTETIGTVRLEENIAKGQLVSRYTLSASESATSNSPTDWRVLSRGTTIGYARIDRLTPTPVRRLRLEIEDALAPPEPVTIRVYAGAS